MSYKTSASCPRKANARRDTIINIYKDLFSKSLPNNKQYWTLAGPCFDNKGNLGTNSEICQLTEAGLIFARQYHGIDNSEEIIEKNKITAPGANFYYGDFITQIQIESENPNFNPGIIHADYTRLKETVVIDTSNIVYLIENINISDVMIVMNFPWNNPYSGAFKGEITPQDVINLLKNNQRFNNSWNERWLIYPKCYTYGGTGDKSKTTMVTFILIRR
jgi:hypothetical protein